MHETRQIDFPGDTASTDSVKLPLGVTVGGLRGQSLVNKNVTLQIRSACSKLYMKPDTMTREKCRCTMR